MSLSLPELRIFHSLLPRNYLKDRVVQLFEFALFCKRMSFKEEFNIYFSVASYMNGYATVLPEGVFNAKK